MDRTVTYDEEVKCDICNHLGAYDFYGDYICEKCLEKDGKHREETKD